MLLNLSNHPSAQWPENQLHTAEQKFADIYDLSFPNIDPSWGTSEIEKLAEKYLALILEKKPNAVHIMGEFTFTFALVSRLQKRDLSCIASTTERIVEETSDGKLKNTFQFIRFREYSVNS